MTNPQNVASHLADMALRQPTTDALLTSPHRDSTGKLSYTHTTFKQLNDQADALARGFASLGITTGTRTALVLRPGIDFFASTFALFKLGAIPVLIDPGIGLKNFGQCLAQAQPAAFIGIPLAHLLRRLLGWSRKTIHTNITTGNFGGIPLAKLASPITNYQLPITNPIENPLNPKPYTLNPGRDAAILFTSGSTGPAKGVLYTHENFDAQIHALKQIYNIQPGEIDLATFPLFALFGPALGMTTVLPDMDFTRPGHVHPPNIIDPIQQLGITNMFGSPALIHRVGLYGQEHSTKLPSLKRVISAGAPASAPSLERFSKMLNPTTQIFTPYGATEALPVSSIGHHEILTHTRELTDIGHGVCVGTPVPNIQIKIIKITDTPIESWSDNLELPPGQIGEIAVQGPAVTTEYFHRPEATALAKIPTPDSFYHRMGDCGYFDAQGRLWFVGRKSQRIQLPTGDLFSAPVEGIFNAHPKIAHSALVGIRRNGSIVPVVYYEPASYDLGKDFSARTIAQSHPLTSEIRHFKLELRLPVDIRHNSKINRELITKWAQRKFK